MGNTTVALKDLKLHLYIVLELCILQVYNLIAILIHPDCFSIAKLSGFARLWVRLAGSTHSATDGIPCGGAVGGIAHIDEQGSSWQTCTCG